VPEFLKLSRPLEALQTLLNAIPEKEPISEEIETAQSLNRILVEDIKSPHPLPEFSRSTVDGYALGARDTFGASDAMPGYLNLVGEIAMGEAPRISISKGSCALIHTGGMLPEGANAVIMVENTQIVSKENNKNKKTGPPYPLEKLDYSEVEIYRAVADGENVIRVGEDVAAGEIVLSSGIRMRAAEIGGSMALGIVSLRVAVKPKIGIISTGDEVINPNQKPHSGQVRDVNSYSLAALIIKAGGEPILYGIIPDNFELIKAASKKALKECSGLIISAGSSASERDLTALVINSLGNPGVLVHGINIRPGKPTILAVCEGKPVIGLPGNPVSALVIAGLFIIPVIEKLLSVKHSRPCPSVLAKITVNVPSQTGREDWVAVKLVHDNSTSLQTGEERWQAVPVFGKSNLIFSLAASDGLVRIPSESTGISANETVEVRLMD
jgi:molybdopterin molybdotransferase